ncbi:MAG TPA: polysaccharide deacetylase family protein [Solirubrobacteraceae bacterium]|nr:polysaccharide deacetylase family protein [Solirubrobacteraceae bacterium]
MALSGCGSSSAPATAKTSTVSASPKPQRVYRHDARTGTPARAIGRLTLPARPPARSVRVPILTWHRVAVFADELTKSIPDETVEPGTFAAQITALAAHGYHPISQLQLFDALFHGVALPSKPVLLTVDDGYVDDVKTILPILQAHRFIATFYIITGRFHEPGFLNPTEVRRLDDAGMDVGAHTRTHVPLATLPAAAAHSQIVGSREDLQRVLRHPVQWFAYPFGSVDASVVAELRRAGFVLAVTTAAGTSERSSAPLTLPRIHIGRTATATTVLACVSAPAACGGGD